MPCSRTGWSSFLNRRPCRTPTDSPALCTGPLFWGPRPPAVSSHSGPPLAQRRKTSLFLCQRSDGWQPARPAPTSSHQLPATLLELRSHHVPVVKWTCLVISGTRSLPGDSECRLSDVFVSTRSHRSMLLQQGQPRGRDILCLFLCVTVMPVRRRRLSKAKAVQRRGRTTAPRLPAPSPLPQPRARAQGCALPCWSGRSAGDAGRRGCVLSVSDGTFPCTPLCRWKAGPTSSPGPCRPRGADDLEKPAFLPSQTLSTMVTSDLTTINIGPRCAHMLSPSLCTHGAW